MGPIIIVFGLGIIAVYSLGMWVGRRPVRGLREAKDRADKKTVDALLERDAAKEFGEAMSVQARTANARAERLEEELRSLTADSQPAPIDLAPKAAWAKAAKKRKKAAVKRKKTV